MGKSEWSEGHLSILDAVETLSSIVDIDFEREVDVANAEEIKEQDGLVTTHTIHWLETEDRENTIEHIKRTFHVVHDYLRDFYQEDSAQVSQPKVVEGIKTIMVLVGEAAKKLDHYTTLFKKTKAKSVKNLKEYQDLQEFYLTRIARKIDDGILGKWILELTKGSMEKRRSKTKLQAKKIMSVNHVYIDMESVKSDTEYELFFLRKDDGTRFFNPRLIRNIKLTADFGEKIRTKKPVDFLDHLNVWLDVMSHNAAKKILNAQGNLLDRFFYEAKQSWRRELVSELYKAIVALMMSSNPKNLLSNAPTKSCHEYFLDFQHFLRKALDTREYQRFIVYPPKKTSLLAHILLDLVHGMSKAFYTSPKGYQELLPNFRTVIEKAEEMQSNEHKEAAENSKMMWSRMAADYAALNKIVKHHPNGPLIKVLDILDKGAYHVFDPVCQFNIPSQLFSLYVDEKKITNLHLPTPTRQEFIHKADVLEEFKGLLRAYSKGRSKQKYLLFNFQDRTSWKEHVRSVTVEELGNQRLFSKILTVVTLAKDTDFYHQVAPYNEDHQADLFFDHFWENLEDEGCGFVFPAKVKKKLFSGFMRKLIKGIHEIFFQGMNVLSVKNRLDFIEIFYLFLELKIIELVQPNTFSMTCKDGIDVGGSASVLMYTFMKALHHEELQEDDYVQLNASLYLPSLITRERIVLPEPFTRMVNALKRIENTIQEKGIKQFDKEMKTHIAKLFKTPILDAFAVFPKN